MGQNSILEFRIFKELPSQPSFTDTYTDLYFFKPNSSYIGIKTRRPTQKKFGFKMNDFEVKVMVSSQGKFQRWRKISIKCDNFAIYRKQIIEDKHQKDKLKEKRQQKVPQSVQEHLIDLSAFLEKNIKMQLGSYPQIYQNQHFQEWFSAGFIKQIYQIKKEKQKGMIKEMGNLSVSSLYHNSKPRFYSTVGYQSFKSEALKEQIIKGQSKIEENTSYPSLMQKLWEQTHDK